MSIKLFVEIILVFDIDFFHNDWN